MFARILRKFHALRPGEYVLIIRNFFLKSCLGILALFGSFVSLGALPHADVARADEPATKAVVIMYHRFGESDFPSTNVTMAQFEAHVAELKSGGYNVISLPKIVAALRSGEALPPKTVGLSGDDAYTSVFTKAWPILKEAGFPLTVFVATDPVDKGLSRYMSWDQLRTLAGEGVTIGSQTQNHQHMADLDAAAVQDELIRSNKRFEDELNMVPDLFAYPYGEASNEVMELVRSAGFVASFGQHSGGIGTGTEMFYLPRFAMNEAFGSIDRFKLAANALPLRVADITPSNPTVKGENPPIIGFTVTWPTSGLDRLNCFASHVESVDLQRLGTRIEVRTAKPMPAGRTRLNCTMPAGNGRWHWFGQQYYVPR